MHRSPYSRGLSENWAAVFGRGNPLLALLPSPNDATRPAPPYPDDDSEEEDV